MGPAPVFQKTVNKEEKKMAKQRDTVSRKRDKRIFRKTAIRTKLLNQRKVLPRGGIRL